MFYIIAIGFVGLVYLILRDLCRIQEILDRNGFVIHYLINGTIQTTGKNIMLLLTDVQQATIQVSVKTLAGFPIESKQVEWSVSDPNFLDLQPVDKNTVLVLSKNQANDNLSVNVTATTTVNGVDKQVSGTIPVKVVVSDHLQLHVKLGTPEVRADVNTDIVLE